MARPFKFDFYIRDWFTGTRHLTPAGRGIYIDLLALMYERGGPIPHQEEDLRRMLGGLDIRVLRRLLGELVAKDKIAISDGMIWNRRAVEETTSPKLTGKVSETSSESSQEVSQKSEESSSKTAPENVPKQQVENQPDISPSPSYALSSVSTKGARDAPREMRGSRLSTDWVLLDGWRMSGAEAREKHGLPPIDLDLEAERFRAHWVSKPGKAAVKLNWRATWINWCISPYAGNDQNGGSHGSTPDRRQQRSAATDEALRRGMADALATRDGASGVLDGGPSVTDTAA